MLHKHDKKRKIVLRDEKTWCLRCERPFVPSIKLQKFCIACRLFAHGEIERLRGKDKRKDLEWKKQQMVKFKLWVNKNKERYNKNKAVWAKHERIKKYIEKIEHYFKIIDKNLKKLKS